MQRVPWGTWLVAWLAAVVFVGGLAYVLTSEESDLRPFAEPVVVETTVRDVVVLPAGQAEVTGTVRSLVATDAVAAPLPLPLQLSVPPGEGGATVEDALVDGRRVTIVWDGGRPLQLSGTGALDLGPTHVTVDATGTSTWPLDDGIRVLTPGDYAIDAPVAVGADGLAEPRDGVRFTADGETTLSTRGGAAVTLPASPLHLEGPGSLELEGTFTIRTREGERTASGLSFGPGPFVVDLAPAGGSVALTAVLRGPLR